MTLRNLAMRSLLLCVAACTTVLAVTGCGPSPADPSPGDAAASPADHLIVYFLHGESRCPTCQAIESYTHEALQTGFADQLQQGRIEWKTANFDLPENEHFAKEFDLQASSVVLVSQRDGRQLAWRNLAKVWELFDNKAVFAGYIQQEIRDFFKTGD